MLFLFALKNCLFTWSEHWPIMQHATVYSHFSTMWCELSKQKHRLLMMPIKTTSCVFYACLLYCLPVHSSEGVLYHALLSFLWGKSLAVYVHKSKSSWNSWRRSILLCLGWYSFKFNPWAQDMPILFMLLFDSYLAFQEPFVPYFFGTCKSIEFIGSHILAQFLQKWRTSQTKKNKNTRICNTNEVSTRNLFMNRMSDAVVPLVWWSLYLKHLWTQLYKRITSWSSLALDWIKWNDRSMLNSLWYYVSICTSNPDHESFLLLGMEF